MGLGFGLGLGSVIGLTIRIVVRRRAGRAEEAARRVGEQLLVRAKG